MRRTIFAVILACAGMAAGCGDDNNFSPTYQNLLFTHTVRIDAAQDGLSSQPGFSWVATDWRHVVCAVFSSPINVMQNQITNIEDLAWVWHTGLGTGREGNIRYPDGRAHLTSSSEPAPLAAGDYYWGVWAFDDAGHVAASSIEYQLQVY